MAARTCTQCLSVGHAALETTGAVGGALDAVGPGTISSWAALPTARRLEAVSDLDTLDRLDAHERTRGDAHPGASPR